MTAAGRPQRDGLSIGAVLAQLRKDFPDVTISKIRFLESEGLVQPGRTPSGYRQFSTADVERLRFVLGAQRDHYLPLKVIKEQLDEFDRGGASTARLREALPETPRTLVPLDTPEADTHDAASHGVVHAMPRPEDFTVADEVRITEDELLAQADIDAELLAELRQYGLVKPGPAGLYDGDAVMLARTVKAMTEYGIEPRHLRAFRAAADREVGLVEQIVAPVYRHRDAEARARGDELVRELAALSVTVHTLLVKAGVRGVAGG